MSKKHFIKQTLILIGAGLLTRLIGFFYRIFLSHTIGAQGMGIYQLLIPVQTLVMAITTAGIQAAISRLVAKCFALGNEKEGRDIFTIATFFAFLTSIIISVILYQNAGFFAVQILKEARTKSFLQLLSFSFPLSTLHTCINSFSYAQKKTGIPSVIQLLEQMIRVGSTYLFYLIFLSEGREITALIAAGGTLTGECAAALLSLFFIGKNFQSAHYHPAKLSHPVKYFKTIHQMSLPITSNRVLITLLGSIEMVLIPQQLRSSGLSASDALSIYGIFTGMAMPLILFPSTITNSASVMLMPSMAELQALGRTNKIRQVISQVTCFCLFLGICSCTLFFFFGRFLGILLFRSVTAGNYIHTLAFICPFLYLNVTLSSILNGLGKPGTCLVHNITGISIRILFVLSAIPKFGIRGYLYGILLSECALSILHLRALLPGFPQTRIYYRHLKKNRL